MVNGLLMHNTEGRTDKHTRHITRYKLHYEKSASDRTPKDIQGSIKGSKKSEREAHTSTKVREQD